MESIELKIRELSGNFPAVYTRKIIEILHDPELSVEVLAGQPCEDVTKVIESLGYQVASKKPMDGWILMKAVKEKK
jgi:hypothetical protein